MGERKGRRGVGTEGAGRACAPPSARTRPRAAFGALAAAGAAGPRSVVRAAAAQHPGSPLPTPAAAGRSLRPAVAPPPF